MLSTCLVDQQKFLLPKFFCNPKFSLDLKNFEPKTYRLSTNYWDQELFCRPNLRTNAIIGEKKLDKKILGPIVGHGNKVFLD